MEETCIGIIGMGYVGLPLAVEFGKHYPVIGFDVNGRRVQELEEGFDRTREVTDEKLAAAHLLSFTTDPAALKACNVYIVTVPTPIDEHNNPDLRPLLAASETVGSVLRRGDIVVYESTVYPGCTEEDCVPLLEKYSGLRFNRDFFCGYSPERINPGDKEHTVVRIKKIVSGSTPEAADRIESLYASIIEAGVYRAPSIRVAEAAKVIENTQRDINIAFVNELSLIFHRMGIDTQEVLAAAGTKWNFLPFRPGLVGGHCIGVDPYYLTFKAQELGYHPEVILAGRRINDGMGIQVAQRTIKAMIRKGQKVEGASVLILGMTFKENCPDTRNSRVIDIIRELAEYGCRVDVFDPWADPEEVKREYGIEMIAAPSKKYDAVVLAVAHREFAEFTFASVMHENTVVFDVKGFITAPIVTDRL